MTLHLKSTSAPIGIEREPVTGLWFWDCRICPGFPTVGHASTHGAALVKALFHAELSSAHLQAAEALEAA